MEIATGLTILGGAVGSTKLIEKILGPTAEYIGDGIKEWTERRVANVNRIFTNAARKLGPKLDHPGAVPPKVLKGILAEGQFCDDPLSAEYFGGVLASSRSEISRDDRGVTYIALLGRLSTYQIRAHYCLYQIAKQNRAGNYVIPTIRMADFKRFMDFSDSENESVLFQHTLGGLGREMLIKNAAATGEPLLHSDTFWSTGTDTGVSLFLWAHGYDEPASFLFSEECHIELHPSIDIPFENIFTANALPNNPAM